MLDIITVVFQGEINLLRIQAESINRFISSNQINSITVIVNDQDSVAELIDTRWWRQHQTKVKIKPYSRYNYISRVTGWENQQLLKLLAAEESTSPWSMVLDAKTWFIQPFDMEKLFDSQGRACVGTAGISPHFKSSQEFIEKYYNVSMPEIIGPGGVPFLFHTETVKRLIDAEPGFIDWFQTNVRHPNLITEFHLYSGFVLSEYGSYNTLHSSTPAYSCANVADWETAQFDVFLQNIATDPQILTASVHLRAYPKLTEQQYTAWFKFLIERQVIVLDLELLDQLNTK